MQQGGPTPYGVSCRAAAFRDAIGFSGRRADLAVRFDDAADRPILLRRPVSAVVAS